MVSLESISNQMESIPWRKENLRKAFEEFQSHSSALSFSLQWKDIEDYFDSIKKSIDESFRDLASKERQQQLKKSALESQKLAKKNLQEPSARALRSLIRKNFNFLAKINKKVMATLRSSSDPATLGLDVMDGLDDWHGYHFVLGSLIAVAPEIKSSEKKRAMKLAGEWKVEIESSRSKDCKVQAMAILRLIIAFGLVSDFGVDELFELISIFAQKKQAITLCRQLGIVDKVPDFIQKLISKRKHVAAVNFVLAFELADKFPPVPLLEDFLKETEKSAQELCKNENDSVKSKSAATQRKLSAMGAVIKSIEQHKLKAESWRESLGKSIVELQRQHANIKCTTATATPTPQTTTAAPTPQQQPMNKRPRLASTATAGPSNAKKFKARPQPAATSVVKTTRFKPPPPQTAVAALPQTTNTRPLPQPAATSFPQMTHSRPPAQVATGSFPQITNIRPSQPTGLVADHQSPYLGSSRSYGFIQPNAEPAPSYDYLGSRLSGGPSGFGGSSTLPTSHLYPSEALSSSLYHPSYPLSGSLPPSYHTPYYP